MRSISSDLSGEHSSSEKRPKWTQKFEKGIDYYIDDSGNYVFTAHYLKSRGYCCENGCRHCPYGFKEEDEL